LRLGERIFGLRLSGKNIYAFTGSGHKMNRESFHAAIQDLARVIAFLARGSAAEIFLVKSLSGSFI